MISRLINNFQRFGTLSKEEIDSITHNSVVKEFRKGDYLLREGDNSFYSYFVLRGCIRQFSLANGEENTSRFFTEEEWVISVGSEDGNSISFHNLVCMEACVLVVGSEQMAQKLYVKHPRLESFAMKIVEEAFSNMQKSIQVLYDSSPEQRYISLINEHPGILQRVQQYHIASYLGIKPESLSRIRKRVLVKK